MPRPVLVEIVNSPRDYAWGSTSMFSTAFDYPKTGKPMAEMWFGTHHGSPSRLATDTEVTLREALGGHELPFLVKFLGIAKPLSMQVHPTSEQARLGFAAEESAGIPLAAGHRNYKDDQHKPEMVIALQDNFRALCGFRSLTECISIFEHLSIDEYAGPEFLATVNTWLQILRESGLRATFTAMMKNRDDVESFLAEFPDVTKRLNLTDSNTESALSTALMLNSEYPNDPGVVTSLLMNSVTINRGDALFLPAGNIHAYLSGLAFEVMAASDNVIRGGLTPKYVDVDELLATVDFSELPVPHVTPSPLNAHTSVYPVPVSDFTVTLLNVTPEVSSDLMIYHEAIVVCSHGTISITIDSNELTLNAGHAAYVGQAANQLSISGEGEVFFVSTQVPIVHSDGA